MAFRKKAHKKSEPPHQGFSWSNETRHVSKPDPAKKKNFAPKRPRLRKPGSKASL